jgi:hypothetical protein
MSTQAEVWIFGATSQSAVDLTGFKVEASDGEIGTVDEATREGRSGYLIVDTGPWIFGKRVMLPGGVIRDVDLDAETVFVDRTREEIKNAPEFDEARYREAEYQNELGTYYGGGRPAG